MNLIDYNPKTDAIEINEYIYYLFEGERCPVCKELKEKLISIDMELNIYVIDSYKHFEFAKENNLVGLPCFVVHKNGEEYDRFYGNRTVERIISFINEE